jgi:excisionase family DNA binding protein
MAEQQTSALLTIAEAAERIGVPRNRFGQWVNWGTLDSEQGVRRIGGRIRIDWLAFQSTFDAWKLAHPRALHSGDRTGQKAHARASAEASRPKIDPEFITVNEAARRMSLHPDSLYRWITDGRLGRKQGVYHIGHRVRICWLEFRRTVIESGRF